MVERSRFRGVGKFLTPCVLLVTGFMAAEMAADEVSDIMTYLRTFPPEL
jgi:hypothetical protein